MSVTPNISPQTTMHSGLLSNLRMPRWRQLVAEDLDAGVCQLKWEVWLPHSSPPVSTSSRGFSKTHAKSCGRKLYVSSFLVLSTTCIENRFGRGGMGDRDRMAHQHTPSIAVRVQCVQFGLFKEFNTSVSRIQGKQPGMEVVIPLDLKEQGKDWLLEPRQKELYV